MLDPRQLRRSPDGRRAPERLPASTAVRLCDRNGCTATATWRAGILVYPPEGHPRANEAITGLTALAVCDRHKLSVHLPDILTGSGAKKILDLLSRSGLDAPDMSRTTLTFVPYKRMAHDRA